MVNFVAIIYQNKNTLNLSGDVSTSHSVYETQEMRHISSIPFSELQMILYYTAFTLLV